MPVKNTALASLWHQEWPLGPTGPLLQPALSPHAELPQASPTLKPCPLFSLALSEGSDALTSYFWKRGIADQTPFASVPRPASPPPPEPGAFLQSRREYAVPAPHGSPPPPARAPCTEDAPSPLRPSQPLTVLRADGPSLQFLQCSFDGSFSAGFNFHTHTQVSSPFKRPSSAPSAPPGTSLCLILSLQSNFSKGLAPLSVLHPPLLLTPQSFPAWPVSGLVGGDHPAGWCFSVLNCCQPLPQPHSFPDPQLPQEAQRPGEERLRLPPE